MKFWHSVRTVSYIVLIGATLLVVISRWIWGLIILLMCYQVALVLMILIRRNIIEAKGGYGYQQQDKTAANKKLSTRKKIRMLVTDSEDKLYFRGFNTISSLAAIVYLTTVFSVQFSTWIGPFPFLFLAFGVLLGLGNFVAMTSVLARFNFHLLFVTIAFLLGYVSEPHYVRLMDKANTQAQFSHRQNLKEFFYSWINDPERRKVLNDTSVKKYPVYFVMANGALHGPVTGQLPSYQKLRMKQTGCFPNTFFVYPAHPVAALVMVLFFLYCGVKAVCLQMISQEQPVKKRRQPILNLIFLHTHWPACWAPMYSEI
ncbi:MAG: hypothetical protein WDO19_10825 [Bacteroidota bacterium]